MFGLWRCCLLRIDTPFLFRSRSVAAVLLMVGALVPVITYWFFYRQWLLLVGYNVIRMRVYEIDESARLLNVSGAGDRHETFATTNGRGKELQRGTCSPKLDGKNVISPLVVNTEDKHDGNWTEYNDLREGGWWEPVDCEPVQHVAIIIPFRDRLEHLSILLRRLHDMLQLQQIAYRIFVAEQANNGNFNKGRVMNIAFAYVQQHHSIFNCTLFHDVDMLPETRNNLYLCGNQPRHLSPAVNEMNYTLPYHELVGGVLAIRTEHFIQVNGFSNMYWGWGGEDDDFYYRMEAENLKIERPANEVGRYTMLLHQKQPATPGKIRFKLVWSAKKRYKTDGVAQLSALQYRILSVEERRTHTHLNIDVGRRLT